MFAKILLNAGGELPRAEAMFDALLAAQRPHGAFTDHDTLGYHGHGRRLPARPRRRAPRLPARRRADARAALRRLAARVGAWWQRHGAFRCDPHQALAILSLAGVLARALGAEVAGTATCRFHFTDPTLLRVT